MKKIILFTLILMSICIIGGVINNSSDSSPEEIEKIKQETIDGQIKYQIEDSLQKISEEIKNHQVKVDALILYGKLKSEKCISFSGKKVELLSNPKFNQKVSMEYNSNGIYHYKTSERNKLFISLNVSFYSEKTYSESPNNFLPDLNLYVLTDDSTMQNIGELTCSFLNDQNFNGFIEQYFNYHEKATFVYYLEVQKKYINNKFFICVNNEFEKILYKN